MKNYEIYDEKDSYHKINSFEFVGLPDPYPAENKFKTQIKRPKSISDLVYKKSRLIKGYIPYAIYIPRAEIMFKIMRACINVEKKEDLWCY